MFLFDLAKTAGMLAMPAGLLWLLLLAWSAILLRRRQWLPGTMFLVFWVLYGAAGNVDVGSSLMAGLERTIPLRDPAGLEPFDAVFVLGGGTDLDPAGRPILAEDGDRVVTAARLWHAGRARFLVASGAGMDVAGAGRNQGEETRVLWRSLGVPPEAIVVVDEPCLNTRQEIAAYRRLVDHRPWRRLALVSSASHLPRALRLAAKAGLDFTPVGAAWRGRSHPFELRRLVPQGQGFSLVSTACWEYLGKRMGQ